MAGQQTPTTTPATPTVTTAQSGDEKPGVVAEAIIAVDRVGNSPKSTYLNKALEGMGRTADKMRQAAVATGIERAARGHHLLREEHARAGASGALLLDAYDAIDQAAVTKAVEKNPLAFAVGIDTARHLKDGTATLTEVNACAPVEACAAGLLVGGLAPGNKAPQSGVVVQNGSTAAGAARKQLFSTPGGKP